MAETINTVYFLNRLRSIQWLCSDKDASCPKALLFIPGPDGRFNGGSVNLIKFLFKGSVGKDLQDETLNEDMDALEDMVLLIKESSVSVIYSSAMKKILQPYISLIPFLVEYTYTEEEENDIDKFQLRKCSNFKRMVLEALADGDGVGMHVPSAYEDIMEVENWPMLQSFALDSVVCPTGFFTARYTIADIGPSLDTIYRTVDGYHVDSALRLTRSMISSHMLQLLSILDCPTVSQRQRLTADDILGPLHVLFDFGELEAIGVVESLMRPCLLLGAATNDLAAVSRGEAWEAATVGDSLHMVVESSEPSTGMRWCRTYFMGAGRSTDLLQELQKLQKLGSESALDEEEEEDIPDLHISSASALRSEQRTLQRLQLIYVKLWLNLRRLVRETFASSPHILSAATALQAELSAVMTKDLSALTLSEEMAAYPSLFTKESVLLPHEQLVIHMDCMNALGEVITADDVEDLGGACWIYIRVSVHGMQLGGRAVGAVAVGDTFLFSPLISRGISAAPMGQPLPLLGDSCCITHVLPYFRSFIGSGVEEVFSRYAARCLRSTASGTHFAIGRSLEVGGLSSLSALLLSDHPLLPSARVNLQLHAAGFVFDQLDQIACVPAVVSFKDVERIWAMDLADCLRQAGLSADAMDGGGYVLVLGLRASAVGALYRAFPNVLCPVGQYIALVIPHGEAAAITFREVLERWRPAFRVNDIIEHRGGDLPVPLPILQALLCLVDGRPSDEEEISFGRFNEIANGSTGSLAMRCRHALGEARRLSSFDHKALSSEQPDGSAAISIVVAGLPGCGVDAAGSLLAQQLAGHPAFQAHGVRECVIDLSDLLHDGITHTAEGLQNRLVTLVQSRLRSVPVHGQCLLIVTLVLCPSLTVRFADLLTVISSMTAVRHVVAVTAPGALDNAHPSGIGHEHWKAQGLEMLQAHCCDTVLAVEAPGARPEAYSQLRRHLDVAHHGAYLMKIAPNAVALLSDDLTHIAEAALSKSSERSARAVALGFPNSSYGMGATGCAVGMFSTLKQLPALQIIRISPGQRPWALLSLMRLLSSVLFPDARTNPFKLADDWQPPASSSKGFRRLIEAAAAKVLSKLHHEHIDEQMTKQLQALTADHAQTMADLRAAVLSVHGQLVMHAERFGDDSAFHQQSACMAVVEANHGYVSAHEKHGSGQSQLVFIGIFNKSSQALLRKLLQACERIPLEPLPMLSATSAELCSIDTQRKVQGLVRYAQRPLPADCWYDGSFFVDFHGAKAQLRPDIQDILQDYAEQQNIKIKMYNRLLQMK